MLADQTIRPHNLTESVEKRQKVWITNWSKEKEEGIHLSKLMFFFLHTYDMHLPLSTAPPMHCNDIFSSVWRNINNYQSVSEGLEQLTGFLFTFFTATGSVHTVKAIYLCWMSILVFTNLWTGIYMCMRSSICLLTDIYSHRNTLAVLHSFWQKIL